MNLIQFESSFTIEKFIQIKFERKLYPKQPVRVVIAGFFICGKTCFLTKLIFKIINDFTEIYTYSPSIHQDTYQTLIECFENHIPVKLIDKVIKTKNTIENLLADENFDPSEIEISVIENIEELKYPQEYTGESTVIILDNLDEKEMNDQRVQALFKRSRHNNISVFIITQD